MNCPQCGVDAPETKRFCECGCPLVPAEIPRNAAGRGGRGDRTGLALVAIGLMLTFFIRLTSRSSERPSSGVNALEIFFDLGMTVGLIGLGVRVLGAVPRGTAGRGGWLLLFAAGIIAALGNFGLRLAGRPVELPPRPGLSGNQLQEIPVVYEQLAKRGESLMAAYKRAEAEVENTRWFRASPAERKRLNQTDLREYLVKLGALLGAIDQINEFFSEPGKEAEFRDIARRARSQGIAGADRFKFEARPLQALRQFLGATQGLFQLVDENWEEWRQFDSFPPEAEQKPWQKEATRRQREALALARQLEQEGAPPPEPTPDARQAQFAQFTDRLKGLQTECDRLRDRLTETRWAQTMSEDPEEGHRIYPLAAVTTRSVPFLRKLSRADLDAFRQAQRAVMEGIDRVLGLFAEAQAGGLERFSEEGVRDLGWSTVGGGLRSKPVHWRAAQRTYAAAYAQSGLIEENWAQWRQQGFGAKGKLKPWQEKARSLQREFDSAFVARDNVPR